MASHCLQNKSNTVIFAYNALHSMLFPYISILITFLSVCLSVSVSLGLCCLYLLHYLQFPHRPLLFHSPNLLNVLSTAWMPSISLVGVLWLFVKEDKLALFMIPFTSELGSQVSLRGGGGRSTEHLQRRNISINASLMGPLPSVGSPTDQLRSLSQWLTSIKSVLTCCLGHIISV